MNMSHDDVLRVVQSNGSKPEWATAWHLWTVIVPRRTIAGRLAWAGCGAVMMAAAGFTRGWRTRA